MKLKTHLEMLKTDLDFKIEQTLRAIKPYNKDRDIDVYGNELKFNHELNTWESIDFKPFWQ